MWLSRIVFLFCVLSSSITYAQDDPLAGIDDGTGTTEEGLPEVFQRVHVPDGRTITVAGDRYKCFNLDEYKELLKLDEDFQYLNTAYEFQTRMVDQLKNQVSHMRLSLGHAGAQIVDLQQERTRLVEKWKEENKLRLEAENTLSFTEILAWGVVVVETIIVGILLGGLVL